MIFFTMPSSFCVVGSCMDRDAASIASASITMAVSGDEGLGPGYWKSDLSNFCAASEVSASSRAWW